MELPEHILNQAPTEDWKFRFYCEYHELRIRLERLRSMLNNWDILDFEPKTPKSKLIEQGQAMQQYLSILRERAELEEIEL